MKHDIVVIKLADMKPSPYNPRKINEDAMKGLAASIDRFGLVQPIIWNKRSGNIVGGHQRYAILKARGVEESHTVVVDLSDKEEKALNIALNNPYNTGHFTGDLQDVLQDLKSDKNFWKEIEQINLEKLVDYEPEPPEFNNSIVENNPEVECPECGHKFPLQKQK